MRAMDAAFCSGCGVILEGIDLEVERFLQKS